MQIYAKNAILILLLMKINSVNAHLKVAHNVVKL